MHPITDYSDPAGISGVHVSRFEENIRRVKNRIGLHRHTYFEVFWLEGRGEHVNDFEIHPIESSSLIFVTAGQVHAWNSARNLRGLMMGFTQEFFDGRCQPPSELLQFSFWFPQGTSPLLKIPPEAVSEFDGILTEIEREFDRRAEGYENMLRWLLRALFIRAERLYAAQDCIIPMRKSAAVVREFRLAVENRFRVTQTVSQYARDLGLSADRLSALVQEHTGSSAGELIRRRLLLEAQRLLAHTDLTISEIAYDLNFQDPSYFSRFFRKQTGQPPGDFRAAIQESYPG